VHEADGEGLRAGARRWVFVLVRDAFSVAVEMAVHDALMPMFVRVEPALAPAVQQADGERDDDEADERLGATLHRVRQVPIGEHDRDAERDERRRMAEAPREAEPAGAADGALGLRGHERRHGDEVIRVARVAKPEEERDRDYHERGATVAQGDDQLVEPEHRASPLIGPAIMTAQRAVRKNACPW
jgi:hypothetical protein